MRKIVVVEDDKFIAAIFTMFLRELGHDLVGRCSTGTEALDLCHRLRPDVVLMDIHLDGDLDGIQTAEQLRRELDIPVIYVSSDTSSHVIKRAIVSNSYGYLVKPINKKELGIGIDLAYYKHKVDQEQRERERGYRQFISDAPMPLMIVQEGRIQYLNHLALDLFKTHYMEDVIALPLRNFIHNDFIGAVERILAGFADKGEGFQNEHIKIRDVHGQFFHAKISGSPIVFNKKKSLQITMVEYAYQDQLNRTSLAYKTMVAELGLPYLIASHDMIVKENSEHYLFAGSDFQGKHMNDLGRLIRSSDSHDVDFVLNIAGEDQIKFKGLLIHDDRGQINEIFFYKTK